MKIPDDSEGVALSVGCQSLELISLRFAQRRSPLRERPSPNRFKVREVFGQIRVGLNCFGIELPVRKFKRHIVRASHDQEPNQIQKLSVPCRWFPNGEPFFSSFPRYE
jgi:hypothetical protein